MILPKQNISTERAADLLKDRQPLTNMYIDGELKIETDKKWDKEVVLEESIVEYFSGSITHFEKSVSIC